MKAIILAAGKGTRLQKYTHELPKGLLQFSGMSLIERQISVLRSEGVEDITIITGYEADKIDFDGVDKINNPDFDTTNMVESLFCAEHKLTGEVIISYADIIYEPAVLNGLLKAEGDVVVTVDSNWKEYWKARYGTVETDLESLVLNEDATIKQLGDENVTSDEIEVRYVGLLKFSDRGTSILKDTYHKGKDAFWDKPWQVSGKTFQQAYMTDMLQDMIDQGAPIDTYKINNGWLEFDTNEDFERMNDCLEKGEIDRLIKLQ